MLRRRLLKILLGLSLGNWLASATQRVFATERNSRFSAGDFQTQLHDLLANQHLIDSSDIQLTLPTIAENGAVVPMTISSSLENIDTILVWVEKNPTPLAASFELTAATALYITTRIKMAESCTVVVVAHQGDRWLRCQQWVQVIVGGCGSG